MPRKRSKANAALPKGWTWKGKTLYYIVPKHQRHLFDDKTWFRLGKSLGEAHRNFSERIYQADSGTQMITMKELFERFEREHMPGLRPSTQNYYRFALPRLRDIFVDTPVPIPIKLIEPHHAYDMARQITKAGHSDKIVRQCSECLSSALSFAVKHGAIRANPLIKQYEKPASNSSDRLVEDEELIAFMKLLPRKWQLYVLFKLWAKGRRKGEILQVTVDDFTEVGIIFNNNKRKKDRFVVPWTGPLRGITAEILLEHTHKRGPKKGESKWLSKKEPQPLFFSRKQAKYINEDGVTSGFDTIWRRYMDRALEQELFEERFTEHDLRAKAVEDMTEQEAQIQLRHTTLQVTRAFYRRKPEII